LTYHLDRALAVATERGRIFMAASIDAFALLSRRAIAAALT
jgi:hypothetical protein